MHSAGLRPQAVQWTHTHSSPSVTATTARCGWIRWTLWTAAGPRGGPAVDHSSGQFTPPTVRQQGTRSSKELGGRCSWWPPARHAFSHTERGTRQRSVLRELGSQTRNGDDAGRWPVRGGNGDWIVVPGAGGTRTTHLAAHRLGGRRPAAVASVDAGCPSASHIGFIFPVQPTAAVLSSAGRSQGRCRGGPRPRRTAGRRTSSWRRSPVSESEALGRGWPPGPRKHSRTAGLQERVRRRRRLEARESRHDLRLRQLSAHDRRRTTRRGEPQARSVCIRIAKVFFSF